MSWFLTALWSCLHFWKENQLRAVLVGLMCTLHSDAPWLVRHPTQMKSEPGHFLSTFYWAVGAIHTQHEVTGLLTVSIETLVLSKRHLVPAPQLHPIWSNSLHFKYRHGQIQAFWLQQGWTKQFLSLIPSYTAHFFSWHQREALMVLKALLLDRFPERVRDYPTYKTLKTGIVDRSWERRGI